MRGLLTSMTKTPIPLLLLLSKGTSSISPAVSPIEFFRVALNLPMALTNFSRAAGVVNCGLYAMMPSFSSRYTCNEQARDRPVSENSAGAW